MTAPLPTPEDVAAMRERHVELRDADGESWFTCAHDGALWPCDAARLLALVDHVESANHANAKAAHQYLRQAVEARARLAAVLAECDRYDQGEGDIAPEDGWRLLRDIRRAATGEGSPNAEPADRR